MTERERRAIAVVVGQLVRWAEAEKVSDCASALIPFPLNAVLVAGWLATGLAGSRLCRSSLFSHPRLGICASR